MVKVLWLVMFLGVVYASVDEFASFLKKSVNGQPTKPRSERLRQLQHEWERSGKFEGDIVLTEQQIDALIADFSGARNSLLLTIAHWRNDTVYYEISDTFNESQKSAIENGIAEIERLSCLKMKKRTSLDADYVLVEGGTGGCFSNVGRAGGKQILNLTPNAPGTGCFRHGTIIHEFLHAIGFFHMQSTHDRDEWVEIVWDKIEPGKKHNFNKYSEELVSNLGTVYDYGSVLHYSEYGFSIDGNKTIVPLKESNETIGQRDEMSNSDIIKLNRLYRCSGF